MFDDETEPAVVSDRGDYFEKRADAELDLASAAEDSDVAAVHYRLAGYYLDLARDANGRAMALEAFADWALRSARKAAEEHGDLAAHYVVARIHACRTLGDGAGAQLWQEVLRLIESDRAGTGRPFSPEKRRTVA